MVAAVALLPGSAHAAELGYDGTRYTYAAQPGEFNDLTVAYDPGNAEIVFDDRVQILDDGTLPGGCGYVAGDTSKVACPLATDPLIDLGDMDDLAEGGHNPGGHEEIHGGPGNDLLRGDDGDDLLDGGIDNDTLLGDDGDDDLFGFDGDDVLDAVDGSGEDLAYGGNGDDDLYGDFDHDTLDGGDGYDYLFDEDDFLIGQG